MGGLDIFKATLQPDGSRTVVNMKAPINSFADDFGIAFENGNEKESSVQQERAGK